MVVAEGRDAEIDVSWLTSVELHFGTSRVVLLVGSIAVKLPRIKRKSVLSPRVQLLQGRNCNRAERAAWIENKYPHLCPILWADSRGLVVVMKRASPMSKDDFDAWFDSEEWPHLPFEQTPFELKASDAGRLPCGRPVMVDYGMLGY